MRVLSEKYRKLFLLQNFRDQMQQRSRTFCRCLWVHCVTVPGLQCPGWIRCLPDTGCMYSCGRGFRLPGCRRSLQRTDPCRPAALPCRSGEDSQPPPAVRSVFEALEELARIAVDDAGDAPLRFERRLARTVHGNAFDGQAEGAPQRVRLALDRGDRVVAVLVLRFVVMEPDVVAEPRDLSKPLDVSAL